MRILLSSSVLGREFSRLALQQRLAPGGVPSITAPTDPKLVLSAPRPSSVFTSSPVLSSSSTPSPHPLVLKNFSSQNQWLLAVVLTVVDSATRLPTVRRPAPRLVTTVVWRATSRKTALRRPRPRRATSAARRAIFPENAPRTLTAPAAAAAAATPPSTTARLAPNVTAAVRSATLLALAPRLLAARVADTAAGTPASVVASRGLATLVAGSGTCRATACRGPSATTAAASAISRRTARNPNGAPAIPADLKDTFRATVLTTPRPLLLLRVSDLVSLLYP